MSRDGYDSMERGAAILDDTREKADALAEALRGLLAWSHFDGMDKPWVRTCARLWSVG